MAVRPDFDGEERVFTFELVLNLEINACEEEELEILSDVYGVVKEVGIEKKKGSFRRKDRKQVARCWGRKRFRLYSRMTAFWYAKSRRGCRYSRIPVEM